eukprot:Sspe_Gene.44803::Locus_22034_Transcript_1_1_Confidence_1.000_Length_1523::g.44803::m.44803
MAVPQRIINLKMDPRFWCLADAVVWLWNNNLLPVERPERVHPSRNNVGYQIRCNAQDEQIARDLFEWIFEPPLESSPRDPVTILLMQLSTPLPSDALKKRYPKVVCDNSQFIAKLKGPQTMVMSIFRELAAKNEDSQKWILLKVIESIPRDKYRFIVGPKAGKLKELCAKYPRVSFSIPERSENGVLTLGGSVQDLVEAEKTCHELVKDHYHFQPGPGPTDQSSSSSVTVPKVLSQDDLAEQKRSLDLREQRLCKWEEELQKREEALEPLRQLCQQLRCEIEQLPNLLTMLFSRTEALTGQQLPGVAQQVPVAIPLYPQQTSLLLLPVPQQQQPGRGRLQNQH